MFSCAGLVRALCLGVAVTAAAVAYAFLCTGLGMLIERATGALVMLQNPLIRGADAEAIRTMTLIANGNLVVLPVVVCLVALLAAYDAMRALSTRSPGSTGLRGLFARVNPNSLGHHIEPGDAVDDEVYDHCHSQRCAVRHTVALFLFVFIVVTLIAFDQLMGRVVAPATANLGIAALHALGRDTRGCPLDLGLLDEAVFRAAPRCTRPGLFIFLAVLACAVILCVVAAPRVRDCVWRALALDEEEDDATLIGVE